MKTKKRNLLRQRLLGLMLIIIAIIAPCLDGDGTASLICVPFGLYALFTHENIIS